MAGCQDVWYECSTHSCRVRGALTVHHERRQPNEAYLPLRLAIRAAGAAMQEGIPLQMKKMRTWRALNFGFHLFH